MKMKTRSLFALGLATMAFAACSNDDSPSQGEGQKGEIIDAISVKFVSAGTYADMGTEDGLLQENKLYHAFVFAKEAAPEHTAARPGDWTVVEVGNGTAEIKAGKTDGQLGNMATFKGVRQGDNVYVLANYPDLDMGAAQTLARNGENSEASIKAFIANVQKEYLNKLAFTSKKGETIKPADDSKYIMAGVGTIPVSPTVPNGTKIVVPVKLDREMAKVFFQATVTKDVNYTAADKVAFQNGDGIIVARVARKVSPFTVQPKEWYFPTPANNADKDWDVTNWLTPFDGDAKSATDITQTVAPFFNNAQHNENAKEYRYTWVLGGSVTGGAGSSAAYLYQQEGWMISPFFYVSPNYTDNAANSTVIATQATYVGAPEFSDEDAQTLFVKAYSVYTKDSPTTFKDKDSKTAITFSTCVWDAAAMTEMNKYFNTKTGGQLDDAVTACGWEAGAASQTRAENAAKILAKVKKVDLVSPTDDEAIAELSYYKGMKVYYRADIANYDPTNTVSMKKTERNTYYKIRATITSLGAKDIEGAINSDDITMQVEVSVNKWNVVFNDIQM